MTKQRRLWVFLSCAIAIVAMILLSASLSELELQPGRPLPRFKDVQETGAPVLPGFLKSEMTRYIVALMYFLALLFLPFTIVYLIVSPRARRRAIKILALFLCLAVLILTQRNAPELWKQAQPQPLPDQSLGDAQALAVEFTANPPQWAILVTATGVALLSAAGLVGVLWLIWQRGRPSESPLEQLAEQAQGAITALQAGADLRDTVMRCYFEMGRVLREHRGVWRDRAMTPREFEQYLAKEGLPEKPVGQLTYLFERVRYGAKAASKREELEAIDCLTAIVDACRTSP